MFCLFQAFQWRCNHHWEEVITQHGCLCFAKQHPLIFDQFCTTHIQKKLQEYWLVITIALQPGLCLKLDVKQKKPIAFGLNSYWDTRWKAVSRASFSVDAPCLLTYPVCWHALYVDAPCMLTRPVRWRNLYVDAPCTLTQPVCWRTLYVDTPCMLTRPVRWRALYVDATCMLTRPVCWRALYVDATCMLTQPVCWRTLYVDTPCMLTSPVCWRTL